MSSLRLRVSTPDDITLYRLHDGRYGLILADVREWATDISDKLRTHPFIGVILNKDFSINCKTAWQETGRLLSYAVRTESCIVKEYAGDIPDFIASEPRRVVGKRYRTVNTPNTKPYTYYEIVGGENKALLFADFSEFKCIQGVASSYYRLFGFAVSAKGRIFDYLTWDGNGRNYRYTDANLGNLYAPSTEKETQSDIARKIENLTAEVESLRRFIIEKFS